MRRRNKNHQRQKWEDNFSHSGIKEQWNFNLNSFRSDQRPKATTWGLRLEIQQLAWRAWVFKRSLFGLDGEAVETQRPEETRGGCESLARQIIRICKVNWETLNLADEDLKLIQYDWVGL